MTERGLMTNGSYRRVAKVPYISRAQALRKSASQKPKASCWLWWLAQLGIKRIAGFPEILADIRSGDAQVGSPFRGQLLGCDVGQVATL